MIWPNHVCVSVYSFYSLKSNTFIAGNMCLNHSLLEPPLYQLELSEDRSFGTNYHVRISTTPGLLPWIAADIDPVEESVFWCGYAGKSKSRSVVPDGRIRLKPVSLTVLYTVRIDIEWDRMETRKIGENENIEAQINTLTQVVYFHYNGWLRDYGRIKKRGQLWAQERGRDSFRKDNSQLYCTYKIEDQPTEINSHASRSPKHQ